MKKGVISVVSILAGAAAGAAAVGKITGSRLGKTEAMSNKLHSLFLMMNRWVNIKQKGKNLASYFEKNGYQKIAVYGMSYAGETLLEELKDSDVEVLYGIDKNSDVIYADIDVVTPEDSLEEVDAVVVTAVTFFDEIEEVLSSKMNCPIISLEDILDEMQ